MDQANDPPTKPVDATEATEDQRRQQELLDNQNGDEDFPGAHQTRHQMADET